MTTPAYLRDLARTYERSGKPAHFETARRLHAIAAELEELHAAMTRNNERANTLSPDLAAGTDTAIQRLRAAQQAQPTPDELAEIRAMAGEHRRPR